MGALRSAREVLIGLAMLSLAGCAEAGAPTCAAGFQTATRVELLFGLSEPDGGVVDAAAWEDFSTRVIAREFPAGYTVIDGAGAWWDAAHTRTAHEAAKVVLIIASGRAAPADHIAAVTKAYRDAFHQQSVGVVVSPTCAAF